MEPGSVTAVVGRPGTGVSTSLARICATAAEQGARVVLASWERPASGSAELVGRHDVAIPQIINWDVAELERCPEIRDAPSGSVIAIDYLQLVDDQGEDAASALHTLAVEREFRVVLGVMARRELSELEGDVPPARAARLVGQAILPVLRHADTAVVLTGTDNQSRRAVVTTPAAGNRDTWLMHWTANLGQDNEGNN